jgi:hypothetical protein
LHKQIKTFCFIILFARQKPDVGYIDGYVFLGFCQANYNIEIEFDNKRKSSHDVFSGGSFTVCFYGIRISMQEYTD